MIRRIGLMARGFGPDNIIHTRDLREYLTRMLALRRGMADQLFAA